MYVHAMSALEDAEPASVNDLHLDETKLSAAHVAERGEIFLLCWLSGVERALKALPEACI